MSGKTDSLLRVEDLKVRFPLTKGVMKREYACVRAVSDMSFEVGRGKTLGLVGESGCGKTTTGKAILRMLKITDGKIFFEGRDIASMPPKEHNSIKRSIQMIFQDPYGSLDPRQSAFSIVKEVLMGDKLRRGKKEAEEEVYKYLSMVGLPREMGARYPHEMSGGQRQRLGIARALACKPKLIICDEPVSALDVSIQAQIINLFKSLQREMGLTYLFVAHDLAVVRHIADTVLVMYLGRAVEMLPADELYKNAMHPYTKALLSAIPVVDYREEKNRKRTVLGGEVPSPINLPPGCPFHPRCAFADERCKREMPPLMKTGEEHRVACFRCNPSGCDT